MRYAYPAILSQETDGRYSIWFPDLRGCASSGENIADAIDSARDALGLWLDSTQRHGNPIPKASEDLKAEGGQGLSWIDVDLDAYRASLNEKAVKKTLTIPAWMDAAATEAGLNFSQVLQESIMERLQVNR